MRRNRRHGVVEYWSDGSGPITQFSNTPLLHHSYPQPVRGVDNIGKEMIS